MTEPVDTTASGLGPTTHFGFTQVGPGETIAKDGYAPLTRDRDVLDKLLFALFNRQFDGAPALGDPTDPPTLVLNESGGAMPAGTTFFYRASFIDEYGLETAASDEIEITTTDTIAEPTAPAVTAVVDNNGTLATGSYDYVITFTDGQGGETTSSEVASLQLLPDGTNAIELQLPDLDPDATATRVYRSRPGQNAFFLLAEVADGATTYVDIGTPEDQSIRPPSTNTTHDSGSVTVTCPGGFIPQQATAWRLYRTEIAGFYDEDSLVAEVVEPAIEGSAIPTTVWIDTGEALLLGSPRETSSTAPSGPQLDLSLLVGSLPLSAVPRGVQCLSAFAPGAMTNGRLISATDSPGPIRPVRFTAFFQTPPTGAAVPTVRVSDGVNTVDLVCSPAKHRPGDPAGLWRIEYPMLLTALFQADDAVRSDPTVVIDPDEAASNGEAVLLEDENQSVAADLGVLDVGNYHTIVRARVLQFGDPQPDLTIAVERTDDGTTLAYVNLQLESTGVPDETPADYIYRDLAGPDFTAPGGVGLRLRVAKATPSQTSYDVDWMRYDADVPALNAGPITVTQVVDGGNTNAANHDVHLWF